MAAFRDEEYLPVDLGRGRDVNLKLKSVDEESRRALRKAGATFNLINGRIDNLTKKAQDANTPLSQAMRIQEEVEKLSSDHDLQGLVRTTIRARVESWDYYKTQADMEAGRPIALTEDGLRNDADPNDLGTIFAKLVEYYSDDKPSGNESTPKNSQPSSLQEGSSVIQTDSIS
jgi:hypothetical protein